MPVHFNSFIADKEEKLKNDLFANIVSKYVDEPEDVFVDESKTKIHMTSFFKDMKTNKKIGKVVITLIARTDNIELVDVDITLLSKNKVKLHFEEKLKQSSEANEYYHVYGVDDERHFVIETVNRYCIDNEIEGKDEQVSLSAFPFQLSVFSNQDELDKAFGMGKEINIPGIGKRFTTMDPRNMSDGRIATGSEEPCSLVIGQVKDYQDVEVDMAGISLSFKIIDLDTAVGIIPVAVNEENFDLSKLKKDVLVCMVVNIKADFKC